jgi:predicted nuclease with RNAse H fold
MGSSIVALGVDVGADRVHAVGLDTAGFVGLAEVLDPADRSGFTRLLSAIDRSAPVAVDGPPAPSAAPFRDDATVSSKFRLARGCEVELGRRHGIWVSFATGPDALTGWMAVAAQLHGDAAAAGHETLEVYPYAVFHVLNGSRPPRKTTAAGIAARVALLTAAGIRAPAIAMWSHDAVDAAGAALVALHRQRGTAQAVTCAADATSIWLPDPGPVILAP